uniref:Uncharacterized protein n=1 Tax=Arundo donax TaxID=35708 RepID=A0A0A9DK87_ARUDO
MLYPKLLYMLQNSQELVTTELIRHGYNRISEMYNKVKAHAPSDERFLRLSCLIYLLRFRLNHFFLPDLSLPSTLPFSGLSGMLCSAVYLLLLLPPAPTGFTILRSVVNEQWILSLSLSISSTCRDCNSLATCSNNFSD